MKDQLHITCYFISFRMCWMSETCWVLKPAKRTPPKTSRTKSSNTQRTENKKTHVVIHQHSRKLLMMVILMSETCWALKKWNKIPSDIKLVFHSSTITVLHCVYEYCYKFRFLLWTFIRHEHIFETQIRMQVCFKYYSYLIMVHKKNRNM